MKETVVVHKIQKFDARRGLLTIHLEDDKITGAHLNVESWGVLSLSPEQYNTLVDLVLQQTEC